MRIVVAVGGNALLQRGEALTLKNQLKHVKNAAAELVKLVPNNELVVTHGNGPQVGLLALQNEAYEAVEAYTLDVLGAETQGMIGYLFEQEIMNLLPINKMATTILTRVEVDSNDPAFAHPTKPIGPVYTKEDAENLAQQRKWVIAADGKGFRRVVPSPMPHRIIEILSITSLLEKNIIVIAAGGGGIPVTVSADGQTRCGVEAVVDKDMSSALLAQQLHADVLLIATDVDAVYENWGQSTQRAIREISPAMLKNRDFPAGSMGPKIMAACQFAEKTQCPAFIGSLDNISNMLEGQSGTCITMASKGVRFY